MSRLGRRTELGHPFGAWIVSHAFRAHGSWVICLMGLESWAGVLGRGLGSWVLRLGSWVMGHGSGAFGALPRPGGRLRCTAPARRAPSAQ